MQHPTSFGLPVSSLLVAAIGLACAVAPGCERGQATQAYKIESLDQAIGGPVAYARVGDFILKNDQIVAAVEGGRSSFLPLDVGGSLIDVDLVRHDRRFRGGRGLDALGQIAPVANLEIAKALEESDVRITRSPHGAEVTASALVGGVLKIVDGINLIIERSIIDDAATDKRVRLYTEYQVREGERMVRIRSTLGFGVPFCAAAGASGCNETCDDALYDDDCQCDTLPAECMKDVRVIDADTFPEPGRGLIDLFLGDLPRPLGSGKCATDAECDAAKGETCTRITTADLGGDARVCRAREAKDAGYFMGDMLIFGGALSVFVPGTGYDTETDIRRLFDKGEDTLATPLTLPAIYGTGDRVSYGYGAPKGQILVPVFGGPFSFGATAGIACRHDQPGCLTKTLVRFERWLSVGTGDVSSANEPLARARGEALGSVSGSVLFAHSGKPASNAQVFALSDPRSLPCEGECRTRCAPTDAVTDEEITTWTLERLFAENRCRTRSVTYLEGTAGVESVARTDPGADYRIDGNYTLLLPPGRFVIVAQNGPSTRSSLAPVHVEAGKRAAASLYVVEPGRLEYALYDEKGLPSAGRVIVGRCFPGSPCGGDGDCAVGQLCYAGTCSCKPETLEPLELGGARFADGTLQFDQTANGHGALELPPGTYDVIFAHGPHSTTDKQTVTISPNFTTVAQGLVRRTVDRSGWIAADFHVHAGPSIDSGLPLEARTTSFLAEDMDLLSSSDHDNITPYQPVIERLLLGKRLASQAGVEVTTQELGHFIGYPMRYEERDPEGARLPGNNTPDWRNLPPEDIFHEMRLRQTEGAPFVVEVPHPYSYFDSYRIDPVTLEPTSSILAVINPLQGVSRFSGDFDAMELINSKSLDLIRRPTRDEVRFYSSGLDALLAAQRRGEIDEETYQRQFRSLATEATRRILHRTRAEQVASLAGTDADRECRCGSDGDCAAGLSCNPATLECGVPPFPSSGPPPGGTAMCRTFRGVVDDWFNMLNRGVRRAGVGGSDVHGLYGYEAGSPRTLLRTGPVSAPQLQGADVAKAILAFRSVVTNGPMVHFRVDRAEVGDTIEKPPGAEVALHVRVEKAPFYDVDRVEIYRNGELLHWMVACGGTRRIGDDDEGHAHGCVRTGEEAVAFDEVIVDRPPRDAWYVVIALGLDGRPLSPVYSSLPLSRFGTFEVTQRLYDLIPTLTALRTPRFPSVFPTFPVAITNPIWVDVGGDGWQPTLPPPSWCTSSRDANCGN